MRRVAAAFLLCILAGSCPAASPPAEEVIARFRLGKPLTAQDLESMAKALDAAEKNDRTQYAKILLDRVTGKRPEAKSAAEALVKSYPSVGEYQATYGTICFESISDAGTFEKMSLASTGRTAYERAIELDSTLIEPRVGLGRFFLMAPGYAGGSYKKAEEQANALIAIPEGKGELAGRFLLADIYADKGDWAKVEEQYRLAESAGGPAANPSNAMRAHAQALLNKKKDPKAALVVLDRYRAQAAADDASVWYLTGEARRALADNAGAIEAYSKAVEIQPAAVNSRFALAETLEKAQRYAEAAVHYREFATRFPSDARAAKATAAAARCEAKAK